MAEPTDRSESTDNTDPTSPDSATESGEPAGSTDDRALTGDASATGGWRRWPARAGRLARRAGRVLAVRRWGPDSRRRSRRALTGLMILMVVVVGAVLGLLIGSRTVVEVGPFNAQLSLGASPTGQTSVFIPPLGSLHMDTHDGPTQLSVELSSLDQARTQAMITDPGGVTRATEKVADDLVAGVIRVGFGGLGAAVLGAMILAALVFRNMRRVAWAGGLSLVVMASSLGLAAGTFRVNAVEEPRYEGLLVNAPALIGDVQQIANDYERYTQQLQKMVTNATVLYTEVSDLGTLPPDENTTRVLHVSDLHLNPTAWSIMRTVVEQYDIDVIADTGDITDWGSGPESEAYVDSIRLMRVPYVFVRGNHDSETGTQAAVAEQPNAVVLDDEVETVAGVTFAGIGDPRFTPDQSTSPHTEDTEELRREETIFSGAELAATIRRYEEPVDVAMVHDPIAGEHLDGEVPLILAGHTHDRRVGPVIPPEDVEEGEGEQEVDLEPGETRMMVQGSTGGAGLRGLEGEDEPESLALSVLYLNQYQQLIAYDDITVGGHGLSEASVQRQLIDPPPEPPLAQEDGETEEEGQAGQD